jgi:hypothetical protein
MCRLDGRDLHTWSMLLFFYAVIASLSVNMNDGCVGLHELNLLHLRNDWRNSEHADRICGLSFTTNAFSSSVLHRPILLSLNSTRHHQGSALPRIGCMTIIINGTV